MVFEKSLRQTQVLQWVIYLTVLQVQIITDELCKCFDDLCVDSLAIRLQPKDLKTPYPKNRTTRITGLAFMFLPRYSYCLFKQLSVLLTIIPTFWVQSLGLHW